MTFNKLIIAQSAITIIKQLESYLDIQHLSCNSIYQQSVAILLIKTMRLLNILGECNTKLLVPL